MSDKWSGKKYLDASLEDVLDRANDSQNQSEIPFVSAVLAAKANRDQARAAKWTSFTASVSAFVAILALLNSICNQSTADTQQLALSERISDLHGELTGLKQQLAVASRDSVSASVQIKSLEAEITRLSRLAQAVVSSVPRHSHVPPPPVSKQNEESPKPATHEQP